MEEISDQQVRERLRQLTEGHGGQARAARASGLSVATVCRVRNGLQPAPAALLALVGVERRQTFVELAAWPVPQDE